MADPSKIAFTSGNRYERVVLKDHANFTVSGSFGTTTVTITHNLGYVPYFKLRYKFASGKYYTLFSGPPSYNIDGNGVQVNGVTVDNSTIQIAFLNDFGAGTITGTVYYRIYAEPQV